MRDLRLSRLLATALILTAPVGLPASALAAAQDDVLKCLGITDDAARLACYDRTVAALRAAPPPPVAPAAPAPAAPVVSREQAFGAERIDRPRSASEEPEAITAKLASLSQQVVDRYTFTLDNGQVWTQVVARSVVNAKPGRVVKIEKAVMGSFNMTIEGVSGIIKVRRVK